MNRVGANTDNPQIVIRVRDRLRSKEAATTPGAKKVLATRDGFGPQRFRPKTNTLILFGRLLAEG